MVAASLMLALQAVKVQPADRLDLIAYRTLGDPAQRLAQVGGSAHERHGELPLVHVVRFVGWGEHFGLIDVIHADGFEDLRLDDGPDPPREALAPPRVQQDRVQHRAEDVVLSLIEGPVADPHGPRSAPSFQMIQLDFRQAALSVHGVQHLQIVGISRRRALAALRHDFE